MTQTRRDWLRQVTAGTALLTAGRVARGAEPERRPNILWLTCEDMSPHLGCYGEAAARTPYLDAFAEESARYTHCYSVSGVCAPSRSCLITGMYPTTLGTCHMRCSNPPPPHVKCFPEYLREAGYYCTNNRKTDYNFPVPDGAWDESSGDAHWKNRPSPAQPFFAVFNFTETHESRIGRLPEDGAAADPPHDPEALELPPYYPDTPVIRRHWAHYFDLITAMDAWVGEKLAELEAAGLAGDTIVFFYSDHGMGLPRAKRWLWDSGLHVPLMVRWPGTIDPGTVEAAPVSFVDFAPTVLAVAGVPVPEHMQGQPFLATDAAPRSYVYAARDRMDERYDLIRAVRDTRYKYIRNYLPHTPYDQVLEYPESFPVMQEMRRVEREGGLTREQQLFFRDVKPVEELYDTEADPHELTNLATDPAHADALARLRAAHDAWMAHTRDLGLVPEMELDAWLPMKPAYPVQPPAQPYALPAGAEGGSVFGVAHGVWLERLNGEEPLARLRAIRALGLAAPPLIPLLVEALDDPMPAVVHWAAIGLADQGASPPDALAALDRALERPEESARLGAAMALVRLGAHPRGLDAAIASLGSGSPFARLYAAEILDGLDPLPEPVRAAFEQALNDDNQYVARIAKWALARPSNAS